MLSFINEVTPYLVSRAWLVAEEVVSFLGFTKPDGFPADGDTAFGEITFLQIPET